MASQGLVAQWVLHLFARVMIEQQGWVKTYGPSVGEMYLESTSDFVF
jgi:hypothetical protein